MNGDPAHFHVVLDEGNVSESFFDKTIDPDIFGNKFYSAVLRFAESKFQDNECPAESIISLFSNQSFQSQSEDTTEDRAFIKINGDSSLSRAKEMCTSLSEMALKGSPEWNILPMTLPVTFGRYHNDVAKAFLTMEAKPSKYTYMYGCSDSAFAERQQGIAANYMAIDLDPQSNVTSPPLDV